MVPIFIGYDRRESIAASVLAHSIVKRSSLPVSITFINRHNIPAYYRPKGEFDSTDFSNARFMVPSLMDYQGWAIFMDCDMLCLGDIAALWNQRDGKYAVMVKKHNHVPKEAVKFLGATQTRYERKNWSSLMMMNCDKCRALEPYAVNTKPGLWMHRFQWLEDDEIGAIEGNWNYLLGVQELEESPLVHWTLGGPWFKAYQDCELASIWRDEYYDMLRGDNPDCAL